MRNHFSGLAFLSFFLVLSASAGPVLRSGGGPWVFYPSGDEGVSVPRVLLIGDSVTNGYRHEVKRLLAGRARVDVWLTPLHLNSDPLHDDLAAVLAEGPYDVVHFNIGLHGWAEGRIPPGSYRSLLLDYLNVIRRVAPDATPIWGSTTPVTVKGSPTDLHPDINPTIAARNGLAAEVMNAAGIEVNDLYATVADKLELAKGDSFHWQPQGYKVMAEHVVVSVESALAARGPETLVVWVAPDGDDTAAGTETAPFRTLTRARDALRQARGDRIRQRAEIRLKDGVYPVDRTLELNARDSHTVFRHAGAGRARLIGGIRLPADSAKRVEDRDILARIVDETVRPRVLQIDLGSLGITDFGELGPRGFRRAYKPAPLELFLDGAAQTVARWPNAGEPRVPLGKVIDPGSRPRGGDYSFRPATFEYGVERAERWTAAADLYVCGIFNYGYADDTIEVASIDTEKGTFTTAHPHIYGFAQRSFCSWYALNLIEEIDLPGEYCVDRESGILYFLPPSTFDGTSELLVSLLEEPMVALEGAVGVRFEGIVFEASRGSGVTIVEGARNLIAGCEFRNLGVVAVQIGKGIAPFPYGRHDGCGNQASGEPGTPVSRELGSWHEYIYKNTAWDREAGVGHGVAGCDIHHTGAGGVSLGGGDRKTLTPAGNFVHNCDISEVNRWDWTYKAPVNIDGVGNRVTHCHLHRCPGLAVYLHGNDHIIAYNEIDRVVTDMSDMGAIYMGRDPSETGNLILHNYFHDIRNFHKGGHGVQAIFYDDCSVCGADVVGNIFREAGSTAAIKFNGGGACRIENNLFVDCPRPLQGAGDNTKRVRAFMDGPLGTDRLRKHVDITSPPYSVKYPRLLAIYRGESPVTTTPERNIVVKADDTLFVNPAAGDYTLRPDAQAVKDVPGFRPIPFERIGLCVDRTRASLPVSPPGFGRAASVFVGETHLAMYAGRNAQGIVYTLDGSDPTLSSPRYEKPLRLTRSTTVRARTVGIGDPPGLSRETSAVYERIEPRPIDGLQFNFQPEDGDPPDGWLMDWGQTYRMHSDGLAFGWTQSNTGAARRRGKGADAADDTLLHFSADTAWELGTGNGVFDLTIRVGDSQYACANQTIFAEGRPLVEGLDLKPGEFRTVSARVTVADGALTLSSRNVPHGPELTRINWLRISKVTNP